MYMSESLSFPKPSYKIDLTLINKENSSPDFHLLFQLKDVLTRCSFLFFRLNWLKENPNNDLV